MKLKSYFAASVEEAMEQASKELGSDAMLVYSRQSAPEARHLASCEVVFGTGAPDCTASSPNSLGEADASGPAQPETQPGIGRLSEEIGELKRLVGRLSGSIARNSVASLENGPLAETLGMVADDLIETGLSEATAYDIIDSVRYAPDFNSFESAPNPAVQIRKLIRDELICRLSTDSRAGISGGGPRTIALVGPSGAGKTTALVKLAAAHSMRTGQPVQILSADNHRVAAAEQLRSYAAILGMGFQLFDTVGGLAAAMDEHRYKDLILIDTPGYAKRDLDIAEELAACLRHQAEIEIHLVLPASMKPADMRSASERYERFHPTRLLFTKIDETVSEGSVVAECLRSKRPVSFLTSGQQIPEDIEEATREKLVDLILPTPVWSQPLKPLRTTAEPGEWAEELDGRVVAA